MNIQVADAKCDGEDITIYKSGSDYFAKQFDDGKSLYLTPTGAPEAFKIETINGRLVGTDIKVGDWSEIKSSELDHDLQLLIGIKSQVPPGKVLCVDYMYSGRNMDDDIYGCHIYKSGSYATQKHLDDGVLLNESESHTYKKGFNEDTDSVTITNNDGKIVIR